MVVLLPDTKAGLNCPVVFVPPTIPCPDQVPPALLAVRVMGLPLAHCKGTGVIMGLPGVLTMIGILSESLPQLLLILYDMVKGDIPDASATVGSKIPLIGSTPLPDHVPPSVTACRVIVPSAEQIGGMGVIVALGAALDTFTVIA